MENFETIMVKFLKRGLDRSTEQLEEKKAEVAANLIKNTDFTFRHNLEGLLKLEHKNVLLFRLFSAVTSDSKMTCVEIVETNIKHLKNQIFEGHFISHSTCQLTNTANVFQAEAQKEHVELIEEMLSHTLKNLHED